MLTFRRAVSPFVIIYVTNARVTADYLIAFVLLIIVDLEDIIVSGRYHTGLVCPFVEFHFQRLIIFGVWTSRGHVLSPLSLLFFFFESLPLAFSADPCHRLDHRIRHFRDLLALRPARCLALTGEIGCPIRDASTIVDLFRSIALTT